MSGLTNNQQALFMLVSLVLIAIGAVSVPAGLPTIISTILIVCGIAGATIKEFLGISEIDTPAASNGPAPSKTTSSTAPVIDWTALQALEGTPSAAPEGSVVNVADNPTSGIVWYAVVDDTGHIQLTNLNPNGS